ncbi:DUF664 domain-containing protein [Isoptericola sediminis]|uniref:DinB family protein n=1 Tax=Isoptericola sediminis TaxID=2733572 RepID=A0A849K4J8_9MICO|nr:DinB family protein [Isoptericola sediminis]
MDEDDAKVTLLRYLRGAREALVWKTEGLSERELRMPRTPTGTNLLGLVKHAASVEVGYFGEVFGREWPTPEEIAWTERFDEEPNADFFAAAEESAEQIIDLYRRIAAFADETIESLPLDSPGRVPWWGDRGDVTLERVVVHVLADLQRHAGHADILREGIDGAVGLLPRNTNIPDVDQAAYVARLRAIAEQFPA